MKKNGKRRFSHYLSVHFFLLGVAESFSDVGIGGLEAETSDEIANLVEKELALSSSVVEFETVLDILELILSEVDLGENYKQIQFFS